MLRVTESPDPNSSLSITIPLPKPAPFGTYVPLRWLVPPQAGKAKQVRAAMHTMGNSLIRVIDAILILQDFYHSVETSIDCAARIDPLVSSPPQFLRLSHHGTFAMIAARIRREASFPNRGDSRIRPNGEDAQW